MPQILNSLSVYKELVEDSEDSWLYGLVAFAVIEEQRFEWMRHIELSTGQLPDAVAIDGWYAQQPDGALLRAKGNAESALAEYSSEAVEEAINDEHMKVLESTLISEIRLGRRFWPQFGVNVAGGIVSAIVFAAVLTIITLIVVIDASPIGFVKDTLSKHGQEYGDGQKNK